VGLTVACLQECSTSAAYSQIIRREHIINDRWLVRRRGVAIASVFEAEGDDKCSELKRRIIRGIAAID
jgi:hypothetical protein